MVPDALSRSQLTEFLRSARGQSSVRWHSDDEQLRAALAAWCDQAGDLLDLLEQHLEQAKHQRTTEHVIALETFELHLLMGLLALSEAKP